jgi:hypothetical protein
VIGSYVFLSDVLLLRLTGNQSNTFIERIPSSGAASLRGRYGFAFAIAQTKKFKRLALLSFSVVILL